MIFDLNNNRIFSGGIAFESEEAKILSIRLDCRTGYVLSAESPMTVEARLSGDTSWINIKASPISLSPWDGTRQIFEVRVTAGSTTARERHEVRIRNRPV